jgi:GMP reductase
MSDRRLFYKFDPSFLLNALSRASGNLLFPFGPSTGVSGAKHDEELQLQNIRLLPNDETEIESRSKVSLRRKFDFPNAKISMEFLPIFAANMFGVGTIEMAKALKNNDMIVAFDKHLPVESIVAFLCENEGKTGIPTVGFSHQDSERLGTIFEQAGRHAPRMIIIDVPNGHMRKMLETIRNYRVKYPNTVIVAGNVATGSMAAKLIKAGADMVKVGIGPGSACTTKLIAGTHRPQAAAARECAVAVHKLGGYALVDGGTRTAGDVAIALALGGDAVMIGGAFAAHTESGQPIYTDREGKQWQEFMGSSSRAYMTRTAGEIAHYRAGEGELQWLPHKGSIIGDGAIINKIEGGLRSAFSYAGASSIGEFCAMARRTYRRQSGGLRLVKADLAVPSNKGIGNPHIISGETNPLSGLAPIQELILA